MYNIEEVKSYLKNNLSERRYEHSLLVADAAYNLAKKYNLDTDKAYVAGLVHDIAKEFSDEENTYYINKYDISDKYLSNDLKPVLHGFIGAYYIKEKYNMDDDICNSVKFHTLGNPSMTLFDKIIFISDKIGRKDKDEYLVELSFNNIDDALIYFFEQQEKKLEIKNRKLHVDTIELLNKLKI